MFQSNWPKPNQSYEFW